MDLYEAIEIDAVDFNVRFDSWLDSGPTESLNHGPGLFDYEFNSGFLHITLFTSSDIKYL